MLPPVSGSSMKIDDSPLVPLSPVDVDVDVVVVVDVDVAVDVETPSPDSLVSRDGPSTATDGPHAPTTPSNHNAHRELTPSG